MNSIESSGDFYYSFLILALLSPLQREAKFVEYRRNYHNGKGSTGGLNNLPEHLRPFFWDVLFDGLSVEESSHFIIGRLMEHGNEDAMRFLLKTFRPAELIHVLKTSRSLSRRSRAFWRVFFDLKDEPCTPKRYPTPYGDYLES